MDYSSFCLEAELFLNKLFQDIRAAQITIEDHWLIDHLCFRVETQTEYQIYQKSFSNFATLLIESEVNGRLISTYKLQKPVFINRHQIWLVELPAPKPSKKVTTGFEHIEIVCDLSFEEIENKYSQCRIDKSGLTKDLNKELEITLPSGALKFHHLSLESVIRLESNKLFFDALKRSKILSLTSLFDPLVAGTTPLGLVVNNSDLDILLYSADLQHVVEFAQKTLAKKFDLTINFKKIRDQECLIIRFNYLEINFELFVQDTKTHRQLAYQHFQIEERLLMLGGAKFLNKVNSFRINGAKTEPAFAQALGIETEDPYLTLAQLQALSEEQLTAKFFKF